MTAPGSRPARRASGPSLANSARPRAAVLWRRGLTAAVLFAFPLALGALQRWAPAHDAVRFVVGYTPKRFLHGALWTLPLSATINVTAHHFRIAIALEFLSFAPYLVLAGTARTLVRFIVGHVGCTLLTFVAIVVGSTVGVAEATKLFSTLDMGVSAGLAAVGGAFVVLIGRSRARWLVVPALAVPLYVYTYRLGTEAPSRVMADVEHLVALAIGAGIEWRWPLRAWPERTEPVAVGDG